MTGAGLVPLVRRWWWLLLAATLSAAAIAAVVAVTATKTYEASTELLVGPVSGDYPTLQASGALARTYADLASSRRIVEAAAGSAHLQLTRKQVEEAVEATPNDVTRIVELRVRLPDADAPVRLARALAGQLLRLRRGVPVDPASPVLDEPGLADLTTAERHTLRAAVERLVGATNPGRLQVVEPAARPADVVSPRIGMVVLLAALAGMLVAAVYAVVRESATRPPPAVADPVPFFEIESLGEGDEDAEVLLRRWGDEGRS
jgi:polysaccharide biosynthesis transport protein